MSDGLGGQPAANRGHPLPRARSLGAFLGLALGVGALTGVVWWRVVDLPGYLVNPDGGASTTERGLAGFIAGDAWFALLGVVAGILLGVVGWLKLQGVGWPLVLAVAVAALAAGLVCWLVGFKLGPGDFAQRLASARPGDLVPIELTLRAKASLIVWPFAATIPVLLGSSLGRDHEEPTPIFKGPIVGGRLARWRAANRIEKRASR